MVAITVILAAVIAAFVLDLGGGLSAEAQASVSTDGSGTDEVTVTAESLANADGIAIIDPSDGSVVADGNSYGSVATGVSGNPLTTVGTEATFTATDSGSDTVDFNIVAYNGNSANPDDRSGENIIDSISLEES